MVTTINMNQSYLIQNFNALADEATTLLGMTKMTSMNESGCCYALALYDLQQAYIGESATQEFYAMYNLVTTQLTPTLVGDLVRQAKLTDEEKKTYLASGTTAPLYKNFTHQFPDGTSVSFDRLYQFMQTIGKLQAGFKSMLSKAQQEGRNIQGKMEGVAGNYENNHAFTCKPDELVEMLKEIRLTDNHSAIISTVGHAFNFRRTDNGHYIVYDANNVTEPQRLKTLQQVSEAILEAVRKVQHFTQNGYVMLAIKGTSFGDGSRHFEKAIQRYEETLLFARPVSGLSKACHDIIVNNRGKNEPLVTIASEMYALYSAEQEAGKVKNLQEFVKRLPPVLQAVTQESLDYFRRAAFADAVEGKGLIDYDSTALNAHQQALVSPINDYLLKYHEGTLARTDLADNVIAHIRQYGDLSDLPSPIHQRLQKLQMDLSTFMEGEVSESTLISERSVLNLQEHSRQGHSLASRVLKESPNTLTLKALLEKAKTIGESIVYDPSPFEDPKEGSANEFLTSGNVDAVAYFMENTDARSLFTSNSVQNVITQGNVAVVHYLLTYPHDPKYAELKLPEQIIKNPQVMALAIHSGHLPLLSALLEKGVSLDTRTAGMLLSKASNETLMALKKAQTADRKIAQEELREKGQEPVILTDEQYEEKFAREYRPELKEIEIARKIISMVMERGDEKSLSSLFNAAMSKGQLELAGKLVMKDLSHTPESVERQKRLFVLAAEKGDIETVKRLFNNNPSIVDAKDSREVSALSKACAGNHVEIVDYLMNKGVNVKEDSSAPLFYAAKMGNRELCEMLIKAGSSIDQKSFIEKFSPIAGVMQSPLPLEKKSELINVLLKADPEAKNIEISDEQRPLVHEAVVAAAKLPNTTMKNLKMLCEKFSLNFEKIPYADGKCLAVHALEANNFTLARELLHKPGLSTQELFSQGIELFNITMKKIRDQEQQLEPGQTKKSGGYDRSLHQELESFLTHLIIELKFPLDVTTKQGETPLMLAAQYHLTKFIQLFMDEGAQVNKQDHQGNTALHYAANKGNLSDILLIGNKCPSNRNAVNQSGELPMHCLAQVSTTPEAIDYLVEGHSVNTTGNSGNTVLHYAVEKDKSLLAVREILAQGADPLQKNGKDPPETALDIVVRKRIDPIENQKETDKSTGPYLGNVVAVLQATPAKALEKDRPMLNKLKGHKRELMDAYEMYLSHAKAACQTPQEKKALVAELDRTIRGENGMGRLLKTKIRLKEFKIDNEAMKRVKEFRTHLVEGTPMRVQAPQGPRNR